MSVREKYKAAQSALFALEVELGPVGDSTRQAVYALRVHLGQIAFANAAKFDAPAAKDEAARGAADKEG